MKKLFILTLLFSAITTMEYATLTYATKNDSKIYVSESAVLPQGSVNVDNDVHITKSICNEFTPEKMVFHEKEKRNHVRWTVQGDKPLFWGNDGKASMDVGFQFDLYKVIDPCERKYLVVTAIGPGVSAGKPSYDEPSHRGYFQTQVSVSMGDTIKYEKGWKGSPLKIEKVAPETKNNDNRTVITTGATFSAGAGPGMTLSGLPMVGTNLGMGINYSAAEQSDYPDFSVKQDSTEPNSPARKCTYWLSGANSKIRFDHQDRDLVGAFGIRDLPQLAKDATLVPHMECVYYVDGDETGSVLFEASVSQKLMEIKKGFFTYEANQLVGRIPFYTTIDFSRVG